MSNEISHEVATSKTMWKAARGAIKAASGPALLAVGMGAMCAAAARVAGASDEMPVMMAIPLLASGAASVGGALFTVVAAKEGFSQRREDPEKKGAPWRALAGAQIKTTGQAMARMGLGIAGLAAVGALAPNAPLPGDFATVGGFAAACVGALAAIATAGAGAAFCAVSSCQGLAASLDSVEAALGPAVDLEKVGGKLREKREAARAEAPSRKAGFA